MCSTKKDQIKKLLSFMSWNGFPYHILNNLSHVNEDRDDDSLSR